MDDVDFAVRCHRVYATHLLETKVLPNEPIVPKRLHGIGSVFNFGDSVILPIESRSGSFDPYTWNLRRPDTLRMSNEVRLHLLDAVLVWRSLGAHPIRVHGRLLPV